MINNYYIGAYTYMLVLNIICIVFEIIATHRIKKKSYELYIRSKELDKTEQWLDRREIELEKTLDYIRKRDSILGK